MSDYWFKAKSCGWGIGRITAPQGFFALSILLFFIALAAYANGVIAGSHPVSAQAYGRFILDILIISILFCLAVSDKIEGGLRWRAGKK